MLFLDNIPTNEKEDELQRCINVIIELQGKDKFWREVQGIQTGNINISPLCILNSQAIDLFIPRSEQSLGNWVEKEKNG